MPLLSLNIPADLANELNSFKSDRDTVVVDAIRQYLAAQVNESDIEDAAAQDNGTDFLTIQEVDYYMAL